MGTQNTAGCNTEGAKLQQRSFQREKSQLRGEGKTEVRAKLHGGWQITSGLGGGAEGGGGDKGGAGACHRKAEMQVRASARPTSSGRFEVSFQAGKGEASSAPPLPGLQWTAEQALTGMSGQRGHRLHQSHKQKQKPQAHSLTHNIWLDTDGQENLETRWGPQPTCHYLSCFLGKVLLQNLGLAAGEERGLEVQTGRKQEKAH